MDRHLTEHRLLQALLWAGIVLFGTYLAWRFLAGVVTVVLLILLGVLLAVILSGPVEALHRYKVPKAVSSPLIVVGTLAALFLVGYLFLPHLAQEATELAFQLPSAISNLIDRVEQLASRLGLSLDLGGEDPSLIDFIRQHVGGILGLFSTLVFTIAGIVAAIFLGAYLAASPDPVVNWIIRLFPPDRRTRVREVLSKGRDNLLSWFKGQLISMTIIGVLSTIALWLIGIPGAVILGILSGVLEFVPYVGPILSAVPPALLGLAGNPIDALYVVVAYLAIQQIESNIVTPLVMRRAVDVHPAVAISVVMLLATVFGLLGAFLAIPIAVVTGVLVKELWFRRLEGDQEEESAKNA